MTSLTPIERAFISATQGGLPLAERPFAVVGAEIGLGEAEALELAWSMARRGIIRRIAAAPNHFALGLTSNGMTVWDVDDAAASALGAQIGALPFVTHCYLRPRALPQWPYNLFAMVHGRSDAEVTGKRAEIAALLGAACRASDVLVSKRILKKTGLRLSSGGG